MPGLIEMLIVLLVVCVILWAARELMSAFGVGNPISTVIWVIIVILVLVYVARRFGVTL